MNDALKAFLDGEATPAETKAVEAALESDASLREERDQFAAISSVLRNETVEPRPIGFERTLMALAEAEKVRTTPTWMVWLPRVVAAAAVCAVVAIPAMFVKEPPTITTAMKEKDEPMAASSMPEVAESRAKAMLAAPMYAADRDDRFRLQNQGMAPYMTDKQIGTAAKVYAPDRETQPQTQGRPAPANIPMPPTLGGSMARRGPIGGPVPPMQVVPLPPVGGASPTTGAAPVLTPPAADQEFLEKAIRKIATDLKGQVMGVSKLANAGGITGRTILVSLSEKDAANFAERAKKIVGSYGSVSDPIDAATEPKRVIKTPPASVAKANMDSTAGDANADPKKQIEELKAKRQELLKDFYEDAKPVKEIDAQIAELQKKADVSANREAGPVRKLVQVTLGGR